MEKRGSNKKILAEEIYLSSSVSERNESGQRVNVGLRRGGLWETGKTEFVTSRGGHQSVLNNDDRLDV